MTGRSATYVLVVLCILLSLVAGPLVQPVPALAASPGTPTNVSPSNGATGVILTPTLRASAFEDADGDSLADSEWQIAGETLHGSAGDLTACHIPSGLLTYSSTYTWSVTYTDNALEESGQSSQWSFTTVAGPHADFSASSTSVQVNEEISFTNASSGGSGSLSCQWIFGDGDTSGSQNPTHAYGAAGTYTVTLTVTDSAGGQDVMTREGYITVSAPEPPVVTTGEATGIGTTSGTLHGNLADPGTAASVSVSFEWGLTTGYGSTTDGQSMAAAGAFSADLTGLAPATTYHFRAVAVGDGTDHGEDHTFTTASLPDESPVVTTGAADGPGTTSATLNGNLANRGTAESVSVSFEWGLTNGYGSTASVTQPMTAAGPFSAGLTGLDPATAYHFRAVGVGDGTAYGDDQTFTTASPPPEAPQVTTTAASAIAGSSATLNLNLASVGTAASVQVSFQWGLTSSYGNTTTTTSMTAAGAFGAGLTGLTPATTYHFRAVAVGDGTEYGADQTFTTASLPDEPPEVTTAAATGIAAASATLNLTLTGLGTAASVQVSFEWGPTTSYGYSTPAQSLEETGSLSHALSGLAPETTYHFRARAAGDGTDYGVDQAFTTAALPEEPPEVTTRAANAIGASSATLNLNLASLGSAASVRVSFEWGLTTSYGGTTAAVTVSRTGSSSFALSGLEPATTYHFRAVAVGDGTVYGGDLTFTTASAEPEPPAVATLEAGGIGTASATLNLTLTGPGTAASVQVSFEWGPTTDYGHSTEAQAITGTGTLSQPLSGLAAATTYHFRAVAVGDGMAYGGDLTFTTGSTPAVAPKVRTNDADTITGGSARLRGELASAGTAARVTVSFVWGTSPGGPYPNETRGAARTDGGEFYFDLDGLDLGTACYFQARAVGDGISYGVEKSFTTIGEAPHIDSLMAYNGRPGQALTVKITGSNLSNATRVDFGEGIEVSEFTVPSDREIRAEIIIRSGAESAAREVSIVTPSGTATYTVPGGFLAGVPGEVTGDDSPRVHLWVYLAVAGGLAGVGLMVAVELWLRRRMSEGSHG